MRSPYSAPYLLFFLALLTTLLVLVQLGALTIAFDKLGLSPRTAFLLLFGSLFGSGVNIPLFSMAAEPVPEEAIPPVLRGLLRQAHLRFTGRTIIAANLGGCLIPMVLSVYLMLHHDLDFLRTVAGIAVVTTVSYWASRPIPGIGIGMPILLAPLTAAAISLLLLPESSAPLAYISGTLGVLIGADVLRLKDIRKMGTPLASIGGAGTFDGIFVTGIVAVLLA